MQAEPVDGQVRQEPAEELLHLRRAGGADRVGDDDLVGAGLQQRATELEDAFRRRRPSNGQSNATAR